MRSPISKEMPASRRQARKQEYTKRFCFQANATETPLQADSTSSVLNALYRNTAKSLLKFTIAASGAGLNAKSASARVPPDDHLF
jgi:hypothetical protein